MIFTTQEARVLAFCKSRPVMTLEQIRLDVPVAPITIHRALKKYGYFCSFNHNARYYTLADKPQFAANGLWFYRSIGFSRYRTLPLTLLALVHDAACGATPEELSALLRTPVGNLLACLARQQQLARRRLGHRVVYLVADPLRQEQQWQQRLLPRPSQVIRPLLPDRLPLTLVLAVLVELIRSPHSSAEQLLRALRNTEPSLRLPDVQAIFDHFQLQQIRGTLQVVELLQDLLGSEHKYLEQLGTLPETAVYTFDRLAEQTPAGQKLPPIVKTRSRRVVSLRFGLIRCREVLRQAEQAGCTSPSGLQSLVATGMRYAYDVIAHVGLEYYLHGNTLACIQQELQQRNPPVIVPLSSLYDLCVYFLYLFGKLHEQGAQRLAALLRRDGKSVWLLDCTQEADSPAFFGVLETHYGILLGCWKMASENQVEMVPCLRQMVQRFGKPGRQLHDLGSAVMGVCDEVLDGVPDGICHFHLTRDVGEDLFRKPHEALSKRMQALKLQMRLRGQRQDQVDYLRKQTADGKGGMLLQKLLAGEQVTACWTATLGREVLLAVHYWILDYAQDGKRQGYPFDPHLLYLHRRLVRAGDALERLLGGVTSHRCLPECLRNLGERLKEYRDDAEIIEAAAWYEKAQEVFLQLRQTLRMTGAGKTPMSEKYELDADEQRDVKREIKELCERWRKEAERGTKRERELYEIALTHLEKYEGKLFYEGTEQLNEQSDRTTNDLERTWRENKRRCRGRHGRGKVKKDMQVMPAEAMLVGNLTIPEYVEAVLGTLAELPQRLAGAAGEESFRSWKARQRPCKVGQLPSTLLRRRNFLNHLLEVCLHLPPSN